MVKKPAFATAMVIGVESLTLTGVVNALPEVLAPHPAMQIAVVPWAAVRIWIIASNALGAIREIWRA